MSLTVTGVSSYSAMMSEIPPQPGPDISIDRGIVCDEPRTVAKGGSSFKIWVSKVESPDLSYKISIICRKTMGKLPNQKKISPQWTVYINNQMPSEGSGVLSYRGSSKLAFRPLTAETLEIQETNENGMSSVWVDLSEDLSYCDAYRAYKVVPFRKKD